MIDISGINHKALRPLIDEVRADIKNHPVVKEMFEDYEVDLKELDYIPMTFAKMDVSAKTEHGIIYFNVNLIDDFKNNDHYMLHECVHWLQQTTGDEATKSSDYGSYLDNEHEVEAFQNQYEYMEDTKGENVADKYIDQVLDHHDLEGNERKKKEELLTSDAKVRLFLLKKISQKLSK